MSARLRQGTSPGKSGKGPAKRLKCPICRQPRSEEFSPFCSKHCADIDLGRWLGGRYVVPGPPIANDPTDEDGE